MSSHTPVCELLGIEHPIVSAPMAADPRLPAAVSNAGALGTMGLWWVDDAGDLVRGTAALTDRPFGGNFALTSDQHGRLDQALSAGLRLASFIFGDPQSYVDLVHDAGGLVMHTVGSAEEARRAVGCGADIVVAQGWEAGGHVWSGVATLPLVPAVVDAVAPVPVIAAGGIGDARGVAAVLALGAQAAWLGTRFLLAQEMPIHEEYRRRLRDAVETDAQWYANLYEVGWPDAPHRAIRNSTAEVWEAAGEPAPGSRPGEGDVCVADPAGESPELGGQVGVVGAGGGPGALGEDVAQPHVAVGGLARAAFAAGDVVARADPGPGGQVGSGRKAGHVGADLGEDALGGPLADRGDGVEPVTGLGERDAGLAGVLGEQIVDALVQPRDRALQVGEVVQAEPDQQGVVVTEAAAQCLAQLGELLAQQALGQLGEDVGVALAGDQGGQHRPAGDAEHLGGDRAQLDPGVLEGLLNALGLG